MDEQTAEKRDGLGAFIRMTREKRGLSLRALAAQLALSPATMSAIERGRVRITVTRLEQVATALGLSAAELLQGSTVTSALPTVAPAGQRRAVGADAVDRHDWRAFDSIVMDPILQAAARLFVANGFHATSMREVAAEAGMSVAGVYHHYASKEQILVALLDLTMSELGWRLQAASAEGEGAVGSFALMVESLALFHAVRGDLAFLGASEMRGLSPQQRARITALRDGIQHALDRQAQAAINAGTLPALGEGDMRIATRAIATMCTSVPSWFRVEGPVSASHVASRYAHYALALLGNQERL